MSAMMVKIFKIYEDELYGQTWRILGLQGTSHLFFVNHFRGFSVKIFRIFKNINAVICLGAKF